MGNVQQKTKHNFMVQAALTVLPELISGDELSPVLCRVLSVGERARRVLLKHKERARRIWIEEDPHERQNFGRKMIMSVKVCT